jgi:hypothetical protein
MKAHRRTGIPTLMLKDGGPTTSSAFGRFFAPSLQEEERRRLKIFSAKVARATPGIFAQQTPDEQKTFGATRDLSSFLRTGINSSLSGVGGRSPLSVISDSYDMARQTNDVAPGLKSLIEEGYNAFVSPQRTTTTRRERSYALGQAALDDPVAWEAESSAAKSAEEAARQEQEGVTPQPTTPVEEAKAAQAEQAAETAKASQAAASVSSPEEEALRQATGAPSSAAEATAAAKSGDYSREASLVQGKDGKTIAEIMGGPEAVFNEKERLNELKTTFGLNLSDMEKAAPGIAFSLSLMGAQRAPGESVFNALARSAGSAGEGALKAKLALDAKERAIDSSLVSTVLGEKKVAEDYVKNTQWVVSWDGGFDKNGSPGASFYRMNARQLNEATEAGLPIVPMDFLTSSMTTEGARAAYRSTAGIDSRKNLMDQLMERAKPVATEIEVGGDKHKAQVWTDRNGVRHVLPIDIAGVANGLNAQLSDTSKFLSSTAEMRTYVPQIAGATNVGKAFGGRLLAIAGVSQDEGDRTPEQLAGAIFAKARKEFDTVKLGGLLSGKNVAANISSEMSSDEIGKYFGKDAQDLAEKGDAEALQKLIQGRLPQITNLTMPERPKDGKPEELTSYQARVKYRTIQNALAAQLAPILLGESGRTISDADRVRVIALLGGFADFSKAGVVTTEFEMNASIDELESILRKYQKTSKDASETFLDNVGEASQSDSWDPVQGKIYNPTNAQNKALGRLGENFLKIFGSPNGSSNPGQPDSTPTIKSSEL